MKRAILAAAALLAVAAPASAETVIALQQGNRIAVFDTAAPGTPTYTAGLTGLAGGERLIGIDVRPSDGRLYGLGEFGTIYTIGFGGGGFVAMAGPSLNDGAGGAVYPFGANFDIDFNPVADRLRVVGATEQSLRVNVENGVTIVDGSLNGGSGDPDVIGAAYTNNVAGAASTTLYAIDAFDDSLATVVPPNSGLLNTVGSLGVPIDAGDNVGFDISGQTGAAFLSVNNAFYGVNLSTGAASYVGAIAGFNNLDIAVVGGGVSSIGGVPEPATWAMMIGGFGLAGAALRRRRSTATA